MKRHNMQDERVLAQRRKISSEAYGILMIALFISMVVQQFFLNAPFEQYAAEFMCFMGISIYILVRYMTLGLDIFSEVKWAKSIPLVSSLIVGITVTVVNGISNYIRYVDHYKEDGISFFCATLVVTFISATVPCFVLMSCLNYLNEKKQEKIEKKLNEEEENK